MKAYEREYKELNLHLFDEVLELIAQEDRVLSRPGLLFFAFIIVGGCILLAGISGVGRRTISQIVAHFRELEFISPKIGRNYSIKEFKKDLKNVFQLTGIENRPTILFIEDHQLLHPQILEYVNSLISSWEIPGLYAPEELEPILTQLQDEVKNQYQFRHAFDFFRYKIMTNLRVVLSLDSTHPQFLTNCSSNPALYAK